MLAGSTLISSSKCTHLYSVLGVAVEDIHLFCWGGRLVILISYMVVSADVPRLFLLMFLDSVWLSMLLVFFSHNKTLELVTCGMSYFDILAMLPKAYQKSPRIFGLFSINFTVFPPAIPCRVVAE